MYVALPIVFFHYNSLQSMLNIIMFIMFIGSSIKYIHDSIYTWEKKSCKTYMFSDYRLLAILYNMAWQMKFTKLI